ncbi:hypothetical protein [Desulfovibrio sp. QI0442]
MAKIKDGNVTPLADALMYVGPRRKYPIPLERGNVFTSLPGLLQQALKDDSALAALFVPLANAGAALRQAERSVK